MLYSDSQILFMIARLVLFVKQVGENRVLTKKAWFDDNCIQVRNEFKPARKQFLKNKSDVNRQTYCSLRSKYSKIKNTAKKNNQN